MSAQEEPLLNDFQEEQDPLLAPSAKAATKPQKKATWKRYLLCLAPLFIFTFGLFIWVPPFTSHFVMSRSRIEVLSVEISSPTNTTFQTHIVSILHLPMAASTKILESRMNVEYKNKVLGSMSVPEQYIQSRESLLEITGEFLINDTEALGEFSRQLIQAASVSWTISGSIQLKILGLPIYHLSLRQDMELEGMQGMSNITIHSINLPGNDPLGGVQIEANATLMNPTNTTLSTGAVNYAMEYSGLQVSLVQTNDLHLVPGANVMKLKGRMLPQHTDENLEIVSEFISKFLQGKTLDLKVRGLGVQPAVSWLNDAISHHLVVVPFKNNVPNDFVKDIVISSLSTEFTPETAYSPKTGASITAGIASPFDFPFNITSVAEMMLLSSKGAMAQLAIPTTPAVFEKNGSDISITTTFSDVPLKVFHSKQSRILFESFLSEMVFTNGSTLNVKGSISASIDTAIGLLRLKGIPLSLPMTFPGMAGLQDPPPTLGELSVTGVKGRSVEFKTQTTLNNPTQFSGAMGDVSLGIWYSGVLVGNVTLQGFNMKSNRASKINVSGCFTLPKCHAHSCDDDSEKKRQQFLTDYITGEQISVNALGFKDSTNIASLEAALSQLNYSMTIPRVPELLQGSQFSILKNGVILELTNPFDGMTVRILSIRANTSHFGTDLGEVDIDFTTPLDPIRNPRGQLPIVLPPKSSVKTSALPVKINGLGWDIVKSALSGYLLINITTEATATLHADGSYPLFLKFDKFNISTKVHL
ncbi:hypothetical protein DSO57_1009898 [Entomophthora muscae]|uniref:Uncharacterized protein n=1 Tax=Entomophthora muscae TaxID=34485 RepID=A0ACC2U4Q0_9FUNG|nr:hypothetical protein DSO57_1009898 [Entomophthora muscae]